MPLNYRLVQRKNMNPGAEKDSKLYYAQGQQSGIVDLDEITEEISEYCTLTSADVKLVLDRFNFVLDRNLRSGRIVRLGDFGSMRMTIGSSGTATEEEFKPENLKSPNITFTPGKKLRQSRKNATFNKVNPKTRTIPCDKPHLE